MEKTGRTGAYGWIATIGVAVTLATFGLGVFALTKVQEKRETKEAERLLVQYKAAGLPWVASDLTGPIVPLKENAAVEIQKAVVLVKKFKLSNQEKHWGELAAQGDSLGLLSDMKAYDEIFQLASEASKKPKLAFKRDWDLGPNVLFPEFADEKTIVKALCYRAVARAKTHDTNGALQDLESAQKISCMIGQDPTVIGMLVQVACHAITMVSVEQCASEFQHDPVALQKLITILSLPGSSPDISRAMRGEWYMSLALSRNLKRFKEGNAGKILDSLEGRKDTITSENAVRDGIPSDSKGRRFATRSFHIAIESDSLLRSLKDSPQLISNRLDTISQTWTKQIPISKELDGIELAGSEHWTKAVVTCNAQNVSMRALLTALIQQTKTGKLPVSIAEIPGKWIDPYTASPLMVRKKDRTLRIYSVGPNLSDDGGITQTEANRASESSTDNFDVAACFPPRPRSKKFGR